MIAHQDYAKQGVSCKPSANESSGDAELEGHLIETKPVSHAG